MLIEQGKSPIALGVIRLLIATVALGALLSEARPVLVEQQLPLIERADPMLALPTEQRQQVVYVEQPQPQPQPQQQQQQQPQEVHYVYSSGGQQQATIVESGEPSPLVEHQYQPAETVVSGQPEQIQYVSQQQPEAPYQLIQVQAEPAGAQQQQQQQQQLHSHEGLSCNKRHEYTSLMGQPSAISSPSSSGETRGEYPGEILYIGQNRELSSDAAGSLAQNSGMPATILTEIPVNEMPLDVLEKLKKDYGVKVVATRERPGANLVINCDDYANQDNSICQRQQNHHRHHHHHQQAQQVFHHQPLEHSAQPQASPYVYSVEEHQQQPQLEHRHHQHHHQDEQRHAPHQHRYRSSSHQEHPQHINLEADHHHLGDGYATGAEVALERSQGEPAGNPYEPHPATNYSVEAPETHHVEYVPVEAQAGGQPSSAASSEPNPNEAYGSRTTVSADEQPESVGPTQASQSAQTESLPQGQQEASSDQAGESAIGSPDNDPRHAGFDEQSPKVAEEQEQHSKQSPNESTTYIDRQ